MENSPKNWPEEIIYTNEEPKLKQYQTLYPNILEGVEIRKIDNIEHILNGQYGLFATRDFKPFEVIGVYTGDIIRTQYTDKYSALLTDEISISALKSGNETRFINHYYKINDVPNVKLVTANIFGKINKIIVTTEEIDKNSEFLLDYGTGYWEKFGTSL